MAFKLNKSIAMLLKLRHVFDVKALRSVNYATFESYLCYASLVWAQNKLKGFIYYRKKSLRIMLFQSRNSHKIFDLKCPRFLCPLIRVPLKTAFLSAIF